MRTKLPRHPLFWLAIALIPLLAGCAADRMRSEGLELIDQGRIEEGMSKLEESVRESPSEPKYRATLATVKERLISRLNIAADQALAADNLSESEVLYRRILAIEPNNERALAGLRAIERQSSVADLVKQAQAELKKGDPDAAARLVESALAINSRHTEANKMRTQIEEARLKEGFSYPTLKSKLSKPVTLEFRDANLKMVFDVLSRTSGINFVFDRDVRSELKATIFVKKIAVEDAIELLILQSGLEKRVINENTLMLFPNTPQKVKEFQELVIKSFYIANADVKQTLNMLKTLLKTKDIYVDEKLNLLIMRDTPDAIRIAEKLIAAQDIAEPEVVLEVEVMEIVRRNDRHIGVQLPEVISFSASVRDNYNLRGPSSIQGTLNLKDRDTASNILASPRIRVKNREKARVLIGDRIPVISSSTTPVSSGTTTTGATNLVVSQSVQYLDTGLKLEVEPIIHLDDEVLIKLNLEVNTLGDQTTTDQGTVAYRVGTRTTSTVLQLRDGETQTLAGLIRDDEIRGAQKVPGLGDLPILGRLFSDQTRDGTKTEIVLAITPRIVRNLRQQVPTITEMVSGSEMALKSRLPGQRPVVENESVQLRGATVPAPRTAPPPPRPSSAPPAEVPPPAAGPESGQDPAAGANQPIALSFEGNANVKNGQDFLVLLTARSDQPVLSTAIQLSFDPQALRVVEVSEGDLLRQDGASTNFSHKVDPGTGKVFIGLSRPGTSGATGRGSLVAVKFAAQAPAPKAPISVTVFSGVGAGNRLLPVTMPAALDVKVSP